MMSRFLAAFAALLLTVSSALADDNVVVVELYTSQGCSSCPPADNLLGQIADRDNIIALALHVDYWDYIGWTDDFASPAHTARQRGYARAKGTKMIYTPQMVIQGETHVVGNKPMDVADAINSYVRSSVPVDVSLERSGDMVRVQARRIGRVPQGVSVHVVTFVPRATRDIRAGENRGRTLSYHNIVRDWRTIDSWSGGDVYTADVRVAADQPVAVIFQAPGHGPVLGAAQLR
ncbi:MAG: DUF1223 domain-containing protein [Pseudomonadota bacterium]